MSLVDPLVELLLSRVEVAGASDLAPTDRAVLHVLYQSPTSRICRLLDGLGRWQSGEVEDFSFRRSPILGRRLVHHGWSPLFQNRLEPSFRMREKKNARSGSGAYLDSTYKQGSPLDQELLIILIMFN